MVMERTELTRLSKQCSELSVGSSKLHNVPEVH